eukprot:694455-Pleurochrysis_carterae.AAC.2
MFIWDPGPSMSQLADGSSRASRLGAIVSACTCAEADVRARDRLQYYAYAHMQSRSLFENASAWTREGICARVLLPITYNTPSSRACERTQETDSVTEPSRSGVERKE